MKKKYVFFAFVAILPSLYGNQALAVRRDRAIPREETGGGTIKALAQSLSVRPWWETPPRRPDGG